MSNPNQFNSPQNPSGPGQVPPVGPSQYNYPSNQGADSQQAPGYPYLNCAPKLGRFKW